MKRKNLKLFSLLMVLVMVLSYFLPFVPKLVVSAEELYYANAIVDVPIAGEHPDFVVEPETDDYTITSVDWYLYEEPYQTHLESTDTFESGKQYALRIVFEENAGNEFYDEASFLINGKTTSCFGSKESREYIFDVVEPGEAVVQFDTREGNPIPNRTVNVGDRIEEVITGQEGYLFRGWYYDDTYERPFSFNDQILGNVTLHAKWEYLVHNANATVTYPIVGETPSLDAIEDEEMYHTFISTWRIIDGETSTEMTPTDTFEEGGHYAVRVMYLPNEGYTFDETTVFTINGAIANSVDQGLLIYEKEFDAAAEGTHIVTFDSNGGSAVGYQLVEDGGTVFEPEDPTLEGYTFEGWYEDESLLSPFNFATPLEGSVHLFAKWNRVYSENAVHTIFFGTGGTYTVVFPTANEDELEKQNIALSNSGFFLVPEGSDMTLQAIPAEGYYFDGWYITHEENGETWVRDQLLSNSTSYTFMPTNNTPYIMPVFEEGEAPEPSGDTYLVQFLDGETVLDSRNVAAGDTVSRPEQDPQKGGFEFDGWFEDISCNVAYNFSHQINEATNIFACFHEVQGHNITFQMDGASREGDVYSYVVDSNTTITATVSGTNVSYSGTNLIVPESNIDDLRLTLSENFQSNNMHFEMNGQVLSVSGDNEIAFSGLDFSDDAPHIQLFMNGEHQGGGEGTDTYDGNTTSTLDFTINGVIEYDGGNGYDVGIGFYINGVQYRPDMEKATFHEGPVYEMDEHGQIVLDDDQNPVPVLDPETMEPMIALDGLTITGDVLHYDSDEDTVDFNFVMAPGTLITGLTINGQEIENLPDTAEELATIYTDHRLDLHVLDIAKADHYDIEIEARYPVAEEEFMGNFLWDYNPQGYTGPDDKILHATLTFVEATYDGVTYTTPEEVNEEGGIFIWKDAERKNSYSTEREGVGEAQFPKGTELTVKIIPDAGYQLVDFGINGGAFETQEEIGTYTFTVEGGPFHLQAHLEQVEDVVNATSNKVDSGSIVLGEEESMAVGTARLDVSDVDLTEEQISNFEEAAQGYEIKNYLGISLFNTVYKGTEEASWDTEVKDLENEAEITLKLEEGINGNEVVIVHEKHDGTYEIIPVTYDAENNTITFRTKSFSNYAVASKGITNPEEYTIKDEDGNEITFTGEEDTTYYFFMTDYMGLTEEELEEAGISKEEYDAVFDALRKAVEGKGTLLAVYEIDVWSDNEELHDGPFHIKIKMTDEMKKFDTFKIFYTEISDEGAILDNEITLTVDGDYLVGDLPHLSVYTLVGSNAPAPEDNPKTGDNIMVWVGVLGVSVLGLGVTALKAKKKSSK